MAESDAPKVVIAVDGSENSERALNFYLQSLRREGQEVHLVHALEFPYIASQPYLRKDVVTEVFDKVKKDGQKVESKFTEILQAKQIKYTVHSDFGNAGEMVCKVASDVRAVMVVLGTRGMGSVRRTILGSVSDYVVHHAHCPVLVARH